MGKRTSSPLVKSVDAAVPSLESMVPPLGSAVDRLTALMVSLHDKASLNRKEIVGALRVLRESVQYLGDTIEEVGRINERLTALESSLTLSN